MKIFSLEVDSAKALKIVGGAGTVIGVFFGVNNLFDWYSQKTMDNLSGEWKLTTITEKTTLKRYEGLELAYKIFLNHDGKVIKGSGEKYWENGNTISFESHTPIEFEGIYDGKSVNLNITEKGKKRETKGKIILQKATSEIEYIGTFSSTAADSKGKAILVKISD